MFNYVILTTHSFYFYSMWDFIYTCYSTISPSRVSLPLYELQDLCMGHEQVLLIPPCLMGFSFHKRIIHGSLVCHPWKPCVNLVYTSMGTLHVHVHRNLASYHYLAPLAIYIYIYIFRIFVCGSFNITYRNIL